jgi:hypothetical protein
MYLLVCNRWSRMSHESEEDPHMVFVDLQCNHDVVLLWPWDSPSCALVYYTSFRDWIDPLRTNETSKLSIEESLFLFRYDCFKLRTVLLTTDSLDLRNHSYRSVHFGNSFRKSM